MNASFTSIRTQPTELTQSIADRVDTLYLQYHQRVYAIALHYCGGKHEWAEDICQDVFYTLLKKLPTLADQGDLGPWLRRVTINRCISSQRRRKVRESPGVRWLLSQDTSCSVPEADFDVSEDLRRVWSALERLPAKQKAVFCLHYFDEQSQTAIAKTMGHSNGYISKLLQRAETYVRNAVQQIDAKTASRGNAKS